MAHIKDVSRLFSSAEETIEPEEASTNGVLPIWLRGSFYQTGPGLLDLPNFTMNNYLDGYAIICKFEVEGSSVRLNKKYPQTESYLKAIETGKPYFMEYGTTPKREGSKSGFLSKIVTTFSRDDMSDNCSASMYQCGNHLIAASATSFFSKINPLSLAVEQRYDAKKLLGQNGYGVHPLIDEDGTMWNCGFSVPISKYNIVKIPNVKRENDASMEVLMSKGTTVASISPRWSGGISLNHSFGMTKNYIILIEQPYVVKINRVLAATMKDYAVKDWLEWRGSEKNKFFIIEKATGKVHTTEYLSTESFFFLHIINCYEEGNTVIVDIARFDTPSSTEATPLPKLRQGIIDEVDPCIIARFIIPVVVDSFKSVPENSNLLQPGSSSRAQAVRKGNSIYLTPDQIFTRGADRAVINPNFLGVKYSFIYAGGSFLSLGDEKNSIMAHSIVKVNVETKETITWSACPDEFPGEPVFVPRHSRGEGDEDDGVLITTVSSATADSQDYLVAIDGKSFKEIGRANFQHQIPMPMHCIFVPK